MNNVLDQVLAIAYEQRALTYGTILRYIPHPERDIPQLDELFARCLAAAIPVDEKEPADADTLCDGEADELDWQHVLQSEAGIEDPIRLYLREIGYTSLLTAAEEVQLAKQVEQGVLARARLQDETVMQEERQQLQHWIC